MASFFMATLAPDLTTTPSTRSMLLLQVRALLIVVAITLLSGHVTPSVDDNNRYLKLTPLGDRVRIAYTVFFGDNPGRLERQNIDANHDGTLSEDEAHAFGARLAGQVAGAIDLDVDGAGQTLTWS